MLWGRDFEIFDEPGLEVPEGLRVTAGREDDVARPAPALNGSDFVAPAAADGRASASHVLASAAARSGRWLSGATSGRVLAVGALVVACGVIVALLPARDAAGGSSDRPGGGRPEVSTSDGASERRAARPRARASKHRLRRRVRRPEAAARRAGGKPGAVASVATSTPPAPAALPKAPAAAITRELAVARPPDGPLPAPAAPPSPFEP
jgi:hypothetical protein